ncbi:hypothetical protein [Streptomyces sp. CL12-4]|uniref:hypothetical protein n=1 Tax=Streptomyces sp. CL12-4 TaxID=2810306 RepID=UPI001EFA2E7F|nr:hypothetical protein [Streptomyces sp. CL12-4]MCG8966297.1 hypothetical protein [Streptomyces sp. CL12-4]
MEIFVTMIVLLAVIALGVLLIHLLNAQHDERIAAFHYGRSRPAVTGLGSPVPRKARGRDGTSGFGARRDHHDGELGRLRPRRRRRK